MTTRYDEAPDGTLYEYDVPDWLDWSRDDIATELVTWTEYDALGRAVRLCTTPFGAIPTRELVRAALVWQERGRQGDAQGKRWGAMARHVLRERLGDAWEPTDETAAERDDTTDLF